MFRHTLLRSRVPAIAALLTAAASGTAFSQIYRQPVYVPSAAPVIIYDQPQVQVPILDQTQLNDLTASIALYPDPLLAVMLPAATYPDQIMDADHWLSRHPNPDEFSLSSLSFEPSVITLMHYPTVLHFMADHSDWTQALGTAFTYQQGDVMSSIQHWRAVAETDGTLFNTNQQQVVAISGYIQILPAQRNVVYVPVYDPAVVYVHHDRDWHDRYGPDHDYIHFNVISHDEHHLDHELDWHDHVVRVPDRTHRDSGDHRTGIDSRHNVPQPQAAQQPQAVKKQEFVRSTQAPKLTYPTRVVAPQPDQKVIEPKVSNAHGKEVVPEQARGRGGDNRGGDRGNDNRGRANDRD